MPEINSMSLVSDGNLYNYYRMESSSDDEKNNNEGTDTSVTFSSGNGKFTNGGGYDGSASYSTLTNKNFSGTTATIGAWVKYTSTATSRMTIFYGQNVAGNELWEISANNGGSDGKLQCLFRGSGGGSPGQIVSSASYNDGNWHLVIGTYNNGTATELFVDGSSLGTSSSSSGDIFTSNTQSYIGANNAAGNKFNGSIDDVFLFTRVLSGAEILSIYAAGPGNLKTVNGLATASIKTINGLAIASVKSINGMV